MSSTNRIAKKTKGRASSACSTIMPLGFEGVLLNANSTVEWRSSFLTVVAVTCVKGLVETASSHMRLSVCV